MNNTNRYASLSDEQLQRIHAACEEFEHGLHNQKPLRMEDFLAAASEEIRGHLFCELLAIELEQRMQRDPTPHISEYHARFPERYQEIGRVFQEIEGTEAVRGPVSVPGYEIEGVLGRGAMGVVYKARHVKLKRTVALKMVLASGHAGPRELARFRIEAEAVARLHHPNIVQIHEIGEADGHPYCALEFVDGGTRDGDSKIDAVRGSCGEEALQSADDSQARRQFRNACKRAYSELLKPVPAA